MGRPTKLTKAVKTTILDGVRLGMAYTRVCALAGISHDTFVNWQKAGAEEGAREPYRSFARELEQAKAQGVQRRVVRIEQQGREDWRALAWLLERQFPEEYGRRTVVDNRLSTPEGPVRVDVELESWLDRMPIPWLQQLDDAFDGANDVD